MNDKIYILHHREQMLHVITFHLYALCRTSPLQWIWNTEQYNGGSFDVFMIESEQN